jgi:exodeoxyribonuclease V alpha subunit
MEVISGYVEHIIYRREENGYTVFQLNSEDGEVTCVGNFNFIGDGELLEVKGEYTTHQIYGHQLQVKEYKLKEPEDLLSIERYLGSGAIKGIGIRLAGRIVRKFKEDTFRIIEEEPERLVEIKGISERMAREIAIQVEGKKEMRQAMIFLQKYGISTALAAKIYKAYGMEIYRVIEENPYRLADEIEGIGFRTADAIASRAGIQVDSEFRIQSGILYTLLQATVEGHIFLPEEELIRRTSGLLGIQIDEIADHLQNLAIDRKIIVREKDGVRRVYASNYYHLELNTARMLHDLSVPYETDEVLLEHRLQKLEETTRLQLDEMQREAVKEAVRNGVFILTGGPGTGKTTTINMMIQYFESEGMDILLGAPTGRAAKRMTEATHYEARTIHRLLEVNGNPEAETKNGFERNEQNPLEADVIIIDEMSMVDIHLMYALLRAVLVGTRLILVGDANQLPSVGPGSVLKDMIDSGKFATVVLNRIFRQAQESDIVMNAHKIQRGEMVTLDNKSRDFFFLKRNDANVIISVLLQLIQKKLPPYVDAEPYDIQVLTPMRKGNLGVERLNEILQKYLNPADPSKNEKQYGDRIFREGDKIMQIRNNYQLEWEITTRYGIPVDKGTGVFNGDMGIIRVVNTYNETLTVEYEEGKKVVYTFDLLDELEHAYAVTIHKSQGSEYPAVVMPLLTGPELLMNRNLLYTAVTRAKKCVTIVGNDRLFQSMIRRENENKRYTSLREQIEDLYSQENEMI